MSPKVHDDSNHCTQMCWYFGEGGFILDVHRAIESEREIQNKAWNRDWELQFYTIPLSRALSWVKPRPQFTTQKDIDDDDE